MCFFVQVKSRYDRQSFFAIAIVLLFGFGALSLAQAAEDWQATLTKEPPGTFPLPRSLRAKYNFGWAGFTAGTADVHFSRTSDDELQLEAVGRTVGLVRALWKFDVNYRATADAMSLRPKEMNQTETTRKKRLVTQLAFTDAGVTGTRMEGPPATASTKTRQFNFPNLFDLHTAMLYLRSRALKDRSVSRIVVYPATSAYLATITVIGREKISVRAGSYKAIKVDLQLSRLGKNLELEPHRKFRRATIWISDDPDRIVLRIEAQIFVGTVFAELQSVRFENPKA